MSDHTSLLEANLEFLRIHSFGDSHAIVAAADPAASPVDVRSEPCGLRITAIRAGSAARVDLHSVRAPREEAIRQVHAWATSAGVSWKGTVVVLGLAGAYHVEVMAALAREGALLLVVDPDPAAVRRVMESVDLRRLEATGVTLKFIVSSDPQALSRLFRIAISKRNDFDISIFSHPGMCRAFPERFQRLHDALAAEFRIEAMDRGTFASKSAEWQTNKMANLPYSLTNPGIEVLRGAFKGLPGYVVAAGPSLNETMPRIIEAKGRIPIIAVGTGLKPLLAAGVHPDFVISVDASKLIWPQFKGVDPAATFLLAEMITYPSVVELFKDRLFSFSSSALGEFDSWLASFDAKPATVVAGGTVTVCAIDAAVYLGLDPVYVFGLDLAFGGDGASHVSGSVYDGGTYPRQVMVRVPGNYEEVVTTRQFSMYINIVKAFVGDLVAKTKVGVVNVNTRGARIDSMELLHPDDLRMELQGPPLDIPATIAAARASWKGVDRSRVLDAWQELSKDLETLRGLAERGAAICASAKERCGEAGGQAVLLAELDEIDASLKREKTALNLINGVLKSVSMNILGEEFMPASEPDSFLKNIERIGLFYSHIKMASAWVVDALGASFEKFDVLAKPLETPSQSKGAV